MSKRKDMSDEQLAELLRERGHAGAATALERKLTAAEVVRRREAAGPISRDSARARLRDGYEAAGDPAEVRRRRRSAGRSGGDDGGE